MKTLKQLREDLSHYSEILSEDGAAPANSMGAAGVSGLGSSTGGVAGFDPVMDGIMRRSPPAMFGGRAVFDLDSDKYHKTLFDGGKKKYKRFKSYGDVDGAIRDYARRNPGKPILVQDPKTGAMTYLRK